MGLEDFKTGEAYSTAKEHISLAVDETVQTTLTGDVTDAQYTLDHFVN